MKKQLLSCLLLAILFSSTLFIIDSVTASSSDDWTMFHHDTAHTGVSSTKAPTSNNLLWNVTTGAPMGASAAIVGNKVYVPSNDGTVYCLSSADGSQVWTYALPRHPAISSSIAVANGYAYFGSYDSYVYCLDASTGAEAWHFKTGRTVQSSPAVVNGYVYIGSWDRSVYCLAATTGNKMWNYTTGRF